MTKILFEETDSFRKKAKLLSKKYRSLFDDIENLKKELQQNPEKGDYLGNNIYKIRLSISF